jgi:hypothetical protein
MPFTTFGTKQILNTNIISINTKIYTHEYLKLMFYSKS